MYITGTNVVSECAEQGRTQRKLLYGYRPISSNQNLKTTDFSRHNNIKRFM
jgi:hypothetical protein